MTFSRVEIRVVSRALSRAVQNVQNPTMLSHQSFDIINKFRGRLIYRQHILADPAAAAAAAVAAAVSSCCCGCSCRQLLLLLRLWLQLLLLLRLQLLLRKPSAAARCKPLHRASGGLARLLPLQAEAKRRRSRQRASSFAGSATS